MHHRREGLSLPAVPIEKEKTENAEHSTKSTADSHPQSYFELHAENY